MIIPHTSSSESALLPQDMPVPVSGYGEGSNINIVKGGRPYFDLLLKMIAGAQKSIHLQAYIFDDDATGTLIAEALITAARRHVNVYILADGYASQVMSQHFIDRLRSAGIYFRFFEPLLRSSYFYFGRRLHHKIFVADSRQALVGGLNIADRYNDLPGEPAWLDFALSVEGNTARALAEICWETWCGVRAHINSKAFEKKAPLPTAPLFAPNDVQIRRNDWVRRKNEISRSYCHMLASAESHITIVCSYFLPGSIIRAAIKSAAQRGIRITLITAGISDVPLAKMAERWMYDWLLRYNVTLMEYQPSVLHAKLAVADDKWLTLGSYNINDLSAYASIELNLDVHDPFLCKRVSGMLQHIIKEDCTAVTEKDIQRQRTVFRQFARFMAYQVIRLIFHLMTFYYRQRD